MPKKKRKSSATAAVEAIWCFYCDRVFKDESTLVTHQKAKHYRCSVCNKKMNTAQGLQVHCEQVHKIKLTGVPGAKEGRENMQIEIFGMAGIPSDVYQDAPPELFRKATKRQVMLGAALVDEKGNIRPDAHISTPSLMSSMLVPPPQTLFQAGSALASSTPVAPLQPAGFGRVLMGNSVGWRSGVGGLVAAGQSSTPQSSSALLFPQGSYTVGSSGTTGGGSTQQQSTPSTGPEKAANPLSKTPFVFPQVTIVPGMTLPAAGAKARFVWKNEESSMEEVRAKLAKYASPNNLA